MQGLILRLDANAKARFSADLFSPEAIRAIQDLATVEHGVQGLATKASRGATVTDEGSAIPPLADIDFGEKLFIIGHGGGVVEDEVHRILRIRTYGGYTARQLAEKLILLGLPLSYRGLIYLTGCAPAAGEGGGFLREFQAELRQLGIPSAVKGALDSTVPDDGGRILVKAELDLGAHLESKIIEMEVDELLAKIGALRNGRLAPNEESRAILDLKQRLDEINRELDRELSFDLVFENTGLQTELRQLSEEIGQRLLPAVQEAYRQKAEEYKRRFFTAHPARKLTLPGGAVPPAEVDIYRAVALREQAWANVDPEALDRWLESTLGDIERLCAEVDELLAP